MTVCSLGMVFPGQPRGERRGCCSDTVQLPPHSQRTRDGAILGSHSNPAFWCPSSAPITLVVSSWEELRTCKLLISCLGERICLLHLPPYSQSGAVVMCVGVTSPAGRFIQKIGQKQIIWEYKGRQISPLHPPIFMWCSSSLLPPRVICSFSLVRRRWPRCIYRRGIRLAALQWCWKRPRWARLQLSLSALIDFHGWQHLKCFQIVISHWAWSGGGIFIIIINRRSSIIWILMQIEIMGTGWCEQLVSNSVLARNNPIKTCIAKCS